MAVTKEDKEGLVKDFGANDKDTGSTLVQIALFSKRIKDLTNHMQVHKKDFSTRRGLLRCVSKRQRLLKFLNKKDPVAYNEICEKLGIRK